MLKRIILPCGKIDTVMVNGFNHILPAYAKNRFHLRYYQNYTVQFSFNNIALKNLENLFKSEITPKL